jgi:hypothetical protein
MAERLVHLGERRGIPPDAATYILQMKYRLKHGDIDGARAAYQRLQSEEIKDNEDLPAVNQLIQAMCASKGYNFDSIAAIVEDLNRRRVLFDAETTAALALLHLSRDELHDAIDLLQTHSFHLSHNERERLLTALYTFCLAPENSTARIWDTYTIIVQIMPEIDRDQRTQVMKLLLDRKRPDLGVHIFNSMRQAAHSYSAATAETYITFFEGLASVAQNMSLHGGALQGLALGDEDADGEDVSQDMEGFGEGGAFGESNNELETIYSSIYAQMKLDQSIAVPSTRLLNSIMLVNVALGHSQRALRFWHQIAASKEGPSWNSLHIALRACEQTPWGDEEAKKIWRRLRRMDVDVDARLWTSYLSALAGHGSVDEVKEGLATFQRETGQHPDAVM